jgi:AraC-like DNA-binding protein
MATSRREHDVPQPARLADRGEALATSKALAGKDVTWLDGAGPRPRFFAGQAGRFPILEALVPPVRIRQRAQRVDVGRHRSTRHLVLHLAGHGCYREAGVVIDQAPGDVVVMDSAAPVEVTHPAGAHVVVLAMPAASTASVCPPIRQLRDSAARLVAGKVETLIAEAPGLGAALQTCFVHQVAGFVDLALADAALAEDDPQAARRQEVLGWLEAHFTVPDLSAQAAADALGLSRRWLHALLEASGTSFKGFLTRRRLETCRARLEDPALAHQSITTIALASGFNDLSTFYRQFRRHYRLTPRALRDGALSRL